MEKGNLLSFGKDEILALQDTPHHLHSEEVLHIARTLGALWEYDYDAALNGRVGMHALLRSGEHSDGYFSSPILLESQNIRQIIVGEMVRRVARYLGPFRMANPDYVAGVPDGATALAVDIAELFGARRVYLKKINGRMIARTDIPPKSLILIVEDVVTRGTALANAVVALEDKQPEALILACLPVFLNRSGGSKITFDYRDPNDRSMPFDFLPDIGRCQVAAKTHTFQILSLAAYPAKTWEPAKCDLCFLGSVPIKPKASEENWKALVSSQ